LYSCFALELLMITRLFLHQNYLHLNIALQAALEQVVMVAVEADAMVIVPLCRRLV
jgi:hypothetical protein